MKKKYLYFLLSFNSFNTISLRAAKTRVKVNKSNYIVKSYINNEDQRRAHMQSHLYLNYFAIQGPVVQSIVRVISSLRGQLVKYFMTL